MEIATYKRIDDVGSWESIIEVSEFMEESDRWVRISHPITVEFESLPAEETVQKQVDGLNKQKKKELSRHLKEVAALDKRIRKLQAITHQPNP